ncbi:hypothetical protein ACH5RR_032460 [Cinchona calisaya]|uniref:RNase H type-1 domain-containing protein n=1 Tax=Cinchona calisaya TaxID=153742 RepID=A0ABD2YNE7_9GENT
MNDLFLLSLAKLLVEKVHSNSLQWLNVKLISPSISTPVLVSWHNPSSRSLKLNVDSSSLGNSDSASGRGLVCTSIGTLVAGFACSFGDKTNMEAEALALICGLQLHLNNGWMDVLTLIQSFFFI